MKVHVLEWNAVSSWHWDLVSSGNEGEFTDELCGICRVAFDGTCPNCKYPGNECPLILGAGCTHNFHLHCILKWLEQDTSRGLCPMCRQVFIYKEDVKMGTSEELSNLKMLIDGHRIMRERVKNNDDQEFDSLDDDLRMAE